MMRYLSTAVLCCLCVHHVCADEKSPIAQTGSLFPLVRTTADRSTLPLSFLNPQHTDLDSWKRDGRQAVHALLHYDPPHCPPNAEIVERVDCGGYIREKLYFNTTPDIRVPRTSCCPRVNPSVGRPIVALHDHGGVFHLGQREDRGHRGEHPVLAEFKRPLTRQRSFAQEAKRDSS